MSSGVPTLPRVVEKQLMASRSFLVCFKEHKRSVCVKTNENIEACIKTVYQDILGEDDTFFLQVRDDGWREFVDMPDPSAIADNSVLKIVIENKEGSQDVFQEASTLSTKMSKPNDSERKELAKLFPHSVPKRNSFNPTVALDGLPDKKKKKLASTSLGRAKSFMVCRLPKITYAVPRGRFRKSLKENGRIAEVRITRSMSSDTIKKVVNRAFPRYNEDWDYLEAASNNSLAVVGEVPNGEVLCSKKGCIYIADKAGKEDGEEDGVVQQGGAEKDVMMEVSQPSGSGCNDNNKVVNYVSSDDELPQVIFTHPPAKDHGERQTLIEQQNLAFNESLSLDQAKEFKKQEKEREEELREVLRKRLAEDMSYTTDEHESLNVRFRMPDGNRMEHQFPMACIVEDLYSYIFSTGIVTSNFCLVTLHPRKELFPFTSQVSGKMGTVVVEERNSDEFPDVYDLLRRKYNLQSDAMAVPEPIQDEILLKEAKEDRLSYLDSMPMKIGLPHTVKRSTVYDDVFHLYRDESVIRERPFYVQFYNEEAVDIGGVTREMFSAFFDQLYVKMFDGSSTLQPALHPSICVDDFVVIGRVLSHAYMTVGVFPDRISLPCLAAVFIDPGVAIPDSLLHDCFINSLCAHDASVIRRAINLGKMPIYPDNLIDGLITVFSNSGCREHPTAKNLNRLILQAARYTFLVRPAAALMKLHAGIPNDHRSFWSKMSLTKLQLIYNVMSVSQVKVLKLLSEPTFSSVAEENVWMYLRQFIGNMSRQELRSFLRFVTGSFVICVPQISIMFNKLEGLARRPISHTCNASIELSSTYSSLMEFSREFQGILTDVNYSWEMDSI